MKKSDTQWTDVEAVAREILEAVDWERVGGGTGVDGVLIVLRRFEREVRAEVLRQVGDTITRYADEVRSEPLARFADGFYEAAEIHANPDNGGDDECDHAIQSCAVCDPCIHCGKRVARVVDMYCSDECELASNPDNGGDDA